MFGYVKPDRDELLVKDYNLYKALYCGLCREIKSNVSFFLSFGLSYDFVFLAIARDMLNRNGASVEKGRCPYNPLKKRAFVKSEGIVYASRVALILVEKSLEDKRRDKDVGLLSPFLAIAEAYLKRRLKKITRNEPYLTLEMKIEEGLKEFSRLESERSDVDTLAVAFGRVLADAVATGLEGDGERIARSLGTALGSWLYLADAVDDFEKDYKKGHFNPLLEQYGTPDEIRSHLRDIDVSFGAWARDAHLALSLVDRCDYTRLADNILALGLGREAYRIMKGDKND